MNPTDGMPELLRPYDPRHTPLPPPTTGVFTAPFVRLCINAAWWSHVSGMIARLSYRDAWVGTDEEISDAIESVAKILNTGGVVTDCECNDEGVPMIQGVRIDGCNLQVTYDGINWETVGDLTDCAVPGPPGADGQDGTDGINGIDGVDGVDGQDGTPGGSVYDPPDTDDTAELCGIAKYLTDWHDALWRNYLDQAAAGASAGAAAAIAITAIVATPATAAIVALITAIVTDAFETGIEVIQAAVGPTQLEDVQCWLYCELKANGYGEATIQNWRDKIMAESGANVGLQYWANGLLGLTQATWDFRANLGALTPSAVCEELCEECEEEGCDLDLWTVPFGTEISRDLEACTITVQAAYNGPDGKYHAQITSTVLGGLSTCKYINWAVFTGGVAGNQCGFAFDLSHGVNPRVSLANGIDLADTDPYTITLTLSDAPF